jgi:hypothetical protein
VEGNQAKQLFERLLRADSEAEVIGILRAAGYWDEPGVWRFYGDQPENWATVGNQQSRAEQALIEKGTNSIDTKLIAAARLAGLPVALEQIWIGGCGFCTGFGQVIIGGKLTISP